MNLHIDPSVEKFILSLEKQTTAKVLKTIELLEEFGNRLRMPHSRHVGNDLFELRIRGQQEVRIFYCFYKGGARLLHGFMKSSQQTPRKELAAAFSKLQRLT